MREIKFKAYLKKENKIVDVDTIDFTGKFITYKGQTEEKVYRFEDIELMQFVGILDKNKEKIYEGDLISFKGGSYVVKYFSQYGRFALSDNIEDDSFPMVIGNPSEYQVVGNIYEDQI